MKISKEFTFDAAHWLPKVPDGHKCKRLHGHTYRVVVWLEGEPDIESGWFADYSEIADAWEPIHAALDHRCLNEIDELHNPTTEMLAWWIWARLAISLPLLHTIQIFESSTTCCEYTGPAFRRSRNTD